MSDCILFVQKRAHRAGAQTCLARLLRSEAIRQWNPVLLCSERGWLTEECGRIGVPVIVEKFPSSRSVPARLFGNRLFARRAAARIREQGLSPVLVQANDHLEGILGILLARQFAAKTSILLRSPGTTETDYFKYRANAYDAISAIGDDLTARIRNWDRNAQIHLAYDGLLEEEFLPPKKLAADAPARVLVLGSPLAWKGWRDLVDAIVSLEQGGRLPAIAFDFTGDRPDSATNELGLDRVKKAELRFLGRTEKFRELVRGYDLVINPSRMETFGMAAIEALAAGVPLLSSRSGVIEQVLTRPEMLFPAGNAPALAERLAYLLQNWRQMDFGLAAVQGSIRQRFHIDRAAGQFDAIFRSLLLP